jgi:hypothetical protein
MVPDFGPLPKTPADTWFMTPLPDYGEGQPQDSYRQQDKRGKAVDAICAPAFVHPRETRGSRAGEPLVVLWIQEGRRILENIFDTATEAAAYDSAPLRFLLQLQEQLRIAAVDPASEQNAVKISHAHVFRMVEELPH